MQHEVPAVAASAQGGSGMTRDEIVAFLHRRVDLFNHLDAAALAADYAEDAVVESPIAGRHTGRLAAEQALRAVFAAFPDRKMRMEMLLIDGDLVAQVLAIEGTHIGEFMGLPPSGRTFRHRIVFLYELRDRRIVREQRIYDFTGLLVQIGVLKARPG